MKRIPVIFFLFLWTISGMQAQTLIQTAESLLNNVIRVQATMDGWGFVIGEQAGKLYVVTAAHVIHGTDFVNNPSSIKLEFRSDLRTYTAEEITWNEEWDVALLEVNKPANYSWERDWADLTPGNYQKVRFIGLNNKWIFPGEGEIVEPPSSFIQFYNNTVEQGVSGAPLLTAKGIIGMVLEDDRYTSRALSVGQLLELFHAGGRYPYFKGSGLVPAPQPVQPSKPTLNTNPDPNMVLVEGGSFLMGCTPEQTSCGEDEKPAHQVTLNDFYLSKYEVTVKEYIVFLNAMEPQLIVEDQALKLNDKYLLVMNNYNKISYRNGKYLVEADWENHPVFDVSWQGAVAYCEWLKQKTGKNYRLPTEAEWEYAARGGNQSKGYQYAGSNNLDEVAWYAETTSDIGTKAVGTKKANELGLHDMSGNVWEWCADWYGATYYAESPATDPKGPDTGTGRVLRGGSWDLNDYYCRVSNRYRLVPNVRINSSWFRLAQDFL